MERTVPASQPQVLSSSPSNSFPDLKDKSAEELRGLLMDKNLYNASLHSTDQVRQLDTLRDDQRKGNIDLASHEIKEIYAFGAGLKSLRDVVGLSSFSNLEFLSLHDNDIDRIEGLERLFSLRELNLSSNKIREMEGLSALSQLQVLNLSCNQIGQIKDLQWLRALKNLVLSHNHIESLHGLSALSGPRYSLRILDLRDNRVDSISELRVLAGCTYLKELSFSRGNHTNPVCHVPGYKSAVIAAIPHLYKLDGELLSGPVPGVLYQILPQFGEKCRSYPDAALPSWVLQYASLGKSDPSKYFPPCKDSDESQPEKARSTSQPQLSVLRELPNVVSPRQDGSGSNLAHITTSEGQHCTKAPPSRYSGCQRNLTRNPSPGSKSVETNQCGEATNVQPANVQTLGWGDQPSSAPCTGRPSLSHDGGWGNSEDSDREGLRTDEELEENRFSCTTRPGLSVTDHSLNGFYRRRWPNTMPTKYVPPPARRKRVKFPEVGDDGPLENLEQKILDLVHELALARRGTKRGLSANSSTVIDNEIVEVSLSDDCEGDRGRCTRKGKESRCHCREEEKQSSSSDTSDNHELKSKNKSTRRVRWSDEESGRNDSGDSMGRWLILVQRWMARMNLTTSDNSTSGAEGSELQKVLQLLKEEYIAGEAPSSGGGVFEFCSQS